MGHITSKEQTLSAATNENATFAAIARAIVRRAILGFVAKLTSRGTCAAFRRAGSSVHSFWQVECPIDEGMAMPRHIGGKHSDPAIGDLARRASVLARNSARSLALFQKAGLVDNQNRVLIGKRFQRVLADNVAQCVGITPPQDSPLAPRPRIAGRFRPHPTGLARLTAQNSIEKLPRRGREPMPACWQNSKRGTAASLTRLVSR